VLALMRGEFMHDVVERLPQEFAARQDIVDRLDQPPQTQSFDAMVGFRVADATAAAASRAFSFSKTMSSFG